MNRYQAYEKAMKEGLRNGRMWLDEARLLYENGDRTHAHAALIFAGEELGKATHCWMAINRVMPFNHPDIDFNSKESVFRDHRLKNATALGFLLGLASEEDALENIPEEKQGKQDFEEAQRVRNSLAVLGTLVTRTRSSCMYVDISVDKKGDHVVHSPLEMDSEDLRDLFDGIERALTILDTVMDMPWEFKDFFEETRAFLEKHDKRFPSKPEWE